MTLMVLKAGFWIEVELTRIQIRPLKEAPDPDPTVDENPGRLRGNLTVRLFSMFADPDGFDQDLNTTVDEKTHPVSTLKKLPDPQLYVRLYKQSCSILSKYLRCIK